MQIFTEKPQTPVKTELKLSPTPSHQENQVMILFTFSIHLFHPYLKFDQLYLSYHIAYNMNQEDYENQDNVLNYPSLFLML